MTEERARGLAFPALESLRRKGNLSFRDEDTVEARLSTDIAWSAPLTAEGVEAAGGGRT